MTRVLVVGGTGWIGARLCDALARDGARVTSFASTPAAAGVRDEIEHVTGDRIQDLGLLRGREFDAAIDLIAYRPRETRTLIEALDGRVGRYVHLGTVAVYRALTASPATETDTVLVEPDGAGYPAGKAACEAVLEDAWRDRGFPAAVVRAAPLTGPADPVSRDAFLLKRLLRDRPIVHPGPLDGHVLALDVDDLVAGLRAAAATPGIDGRTYHLAQRDPATLLAHVREIARLAGLPSEAADRLLRVVDIETLAARGVRIHAIPYAPAARQCLDPGRAVAELDWSPTPRRDSLARTIDWYMRNDPETEPAWPGRASTQAALCGTHEWLHADVERHWATDAAPPDVAVGEVLAVLEGLPPPGRRWAVVGADARMDPGGWPAPERDGGRGRTDVVVVPPALLGPQPHSEGTDSGEGDEPEPRRRAGEPILEPDASWALAAVLQPIPLGDARLFTRSAPDVAQDYGPGNAPPRVRIAGFAEVDPMGPGGEERVLATLGAPADARAFAHWLLRAERRGHLDIPFLPAFARLWVAGSASWCCPDGGGSPGGRRPAPIGPDEGIGDGMLPDGLSEAPDAVRWACAGALARLLTDAETELPAHDLRLRISAPGRPLFAVGAGTDRGSDRLFRAPRRQRLVTVGDRPFAADLEARRIWTLTPALAAVYEAALRSASRRVAVALLCRVFDMPEGRAAGLWREGTERLLAAGALRAAGREASAQLETGSPRPA